MILNDIPKTFSQDTTAWIDMRRWNLIKQALSFVVAKHTGVWHRYKGRSQGDSGLDRFDISDLALWQDILAIVTQEQKIDEFYKQNNITPLRIWYEELFDSKPALVLRVLKIIDPQVNLAGLVSRELDGDTERSAKDDLLGVELAFKNMGSFLTTSTPIEALLT